MTRKLPQIPKVVKGTISDSEVRLLPYIKDEGSLILEGLFESGDDPTTIKILESLPQHRQWHKFIHELIHHLEYHYFFELRDEDEDEGETNIYDRLAIAILDCWLRNDWKLPGEE